MAAPFSRGRPPNPCCFNTQPPEGGCDEAENLSTRSLVSTHSHPKVAATITDLLSTAYEVSTHSHPKVAACRCLPTCGWGNVSTHSHPKVAACDSQREKLTAAVSTHSHPKVAASVRRNHWGEGGSFNTQPPEGGCQVASNKPEGLSVSTHSHPKVAAWVLPKCLWFSTFQHTATRRWLPKGLTLENCPVEFQHTATRRWLLPKFPTGFFSQRVSTHSHPKVAAHHRYGFRCTEKVSTHSHPKVAAATEPAPQPKLEVSTHSHPKVAARDAGDAGRQDDCFNTQPPEGGCTLSVTAEGLIAVSTHSHPKVAANPPAGGGGKEKFQHTATRRWLPLRVK